MNFSSSYNQFVQYFNEKDFFKKLAKLSGKLGKGVLYHLLLLFYMLADKSIPYRKRLIILAALGYFILPTDFIADFIPVLGFTDDVSFLVFAVSSVNEHITDDLSEKARKTVEILIGKKASKEEKISDKLTDTE
ncbi:MAG TPA: YkvA family protein [Bacteroidales bacterium]